MHNFHGIGNILPFEKYAKYSQYLIRLDNCVPFGRPSAVKVIMQEITEFVVSKN